MLSVVMLNVVILSVVAPLGVPKVSKDYLKSQDHLDD
jgi:hypothetical protein